MCVPECTCEKVPVRMYVRVYMDWKLNSGVLHDCSPHYFLKQDLSLNLEFTKLASK